MYRKSTHKHILTAFLAVISLILSLVKMAIPFIPPFLTLDFAFIPIFFALLIVGYKSALMVSLLKNILSFLLITHEPIGSVANFIVEIIFVSSIYYFYKKGTKSAILGGIIGTILVTIVMSIVNYFVLLPLYGYIMDLTDILNNIKLIITYGIVPFNLIKGIFSIVLFFAAKRLAVKMPKSITGKYHTN
ncbi:ECF transporter S component [Gemelliphila palaticanis]|uniref:Riboflavin transporter n=1 Tax=Gemelliphila palaticanis TaxID=81950 RepID=A0ABX2T391_9BACL|nr:ECF transporter S component [Gemella palaticanis]MBF0716157.1 ECF transporter S component [Gemella palaticanis]NYS48087.1 ECF transporter S component [Gemella palaticanis]